MAIPARPIYALLFSLYIVFSSAQERKQTDENTDLKALAERIITHYLLYDSFQMLDGPFFLGIDGPPGGGKSSLSEPLKKYVVEAAKRRGLDLRINVFPQDNFLRKRSDREAEFKLEHGIGTSGNCDFREYRKDALMACVNEVSRGRDFWGYCYRNGDLHGPDHYSQGGAHIIIFEGTHSLGECLSPFMHVSIFLDASNQLIRDNRYRREVRKGRNWDVIKAMTDVAESQYPEHIRPNARRAQEVFMVVPHSEPLQNIQAIRAGNAPELERHVERTTVDRFPVRLTQSQQLAMEAMQMSGVIGRVSGSLEANIAPAPEAFWMGLTDFLLTHNMQLHIPPRTARGDCFFIALAQAYRQLGIGSRDEAVDRLQRLQQQIHHGILSTAQLQVINAIQDSLNLEIEHIASGGWGGLTTMMFLWAAAIGSEQPPTESLYFMFRLGSKTFIQRLDPDGTIHNVTELPPGANVLIYDGVTHWMWAEAELESGDSSSLADMSEGEVFLPSQDLNTVVGIIAVMGVVVNKADIPK